MEKELEHYLEKFHKQLANLEEKREGLWWAFLRGIMTGFGSILGVAIALAIAGYILNVIGVIPAFREQAKNWQQTLEQIKKVR